MRRHNLAAFFAGLVFGLGLLVGGMTEPSKVQSFLDLKGAWDPSLALVMAAAIVVATPAFAWARRRSKSLLGSPMQLPTQVGIDRSLLLGSVIFGAGWGLAGFCPGPALVSAATGQLQSLVFVLAMLVGMSVHKRSTLNVRVGRD